LEFIIIRAIILGKLNGGMQMPTIALSHLLAKNMDISKHPTTTHSRCKQAVTHART